MIAYATLGVNDMDRAIAFYDAALAPLGAVRGVTSDTWTSYARPGERTRVVLVRPFDGEAASRGNGQMLAFEAPNPSAVDAFHAAALAQGGADEGLPGVREETHYVAYVRDLDGAKLCAFAPVGT